LRSGGGSQSSNIKIILCAHCWVQNVESKDPVGAHLLVGNSYANEYRNNYFHGIKWDHGSGRVYGFFLFNRNSDHLIENNIVTGSRHAMIFEGGGSGVVFGYNHARDGLDSNSPTWVTHDAATHGAHPYMNLWEGNVHEKIGHDLTHGSASHQTHFRNFVWGSNSPTKQARYPVDIQKSHYYMNIVGNVLCRDDVSCKQIYRLGCEAPGSCNTNDPLVTSTLLRHGNYDALSLSTVWDPTITNQTLPNSYYLSSKPSWFGIHPQHILR